MGPPTFIAAAPVDDPASREGLIDWPRAKGYTVSTMIANSPELVATAKEAALMKSERHLVRTFSVVQAGGSKT